MTLPPVFSAVSSIIGTRNDEELAALFQAMHEVLGVAPFATRIVPDTPVPRFAALLAQPDSFIKPPCAM